MSEAPIAKQAFLDRLPPEWSEDLTAAIARGLAERPHSLVVLDDDPTGTQTVHDLPVLTGWEVADLAAELQRSPVFYILTNSRSLPAGEAAALNRTIGARLAEAARQVGRRFAVVSRSDSTLRGHYPVEVDALAAAVGLPEAVHVIVPFFAEGGRWTLDAVHYALQGDELVPAAQTEFARDKVFGYRHSDLRQWVEEKTGGRIPAAEVLSVTLEDLRRGGPGVVAEKLRGHPGPGAAVVDSVTYRDQEVFVAGLLEAEAAGSRFVYRTGASFVRVRGGIAPRPLLRAGEMVAAGSRGGGLVVVGSHVAKTTEQVERALALSGIAPVELAVDALLDEAGRDGEVERARAAVGRELAAGRDVVLYTTRELKAGADHAANLAIGRTVSRGLTDVVHGLAEPPRFLIAKGGITSSDTATRGLGVRRAMVLGQILPGVPVWGLGGESRFPGMSYVVFPGNVGTADSLAEAITILRG